MKVGIFKSHRNSIMISARLTVLLLLAILFVIIVTFVRNAYSASVTTTPNGVTLVTETFPGRRLELYLTCFTAYDPGATYTCNNAGESDINAGKVDIKEITDKIEVQVAIPTLGSASLTVGVFGKAKNTTNWGLLYDKTYTAITPTGEDDYFPILERPQDFRICTKVVTPGTDSITITVDLREDY